MDNTLYTFNGAASNSRRKHFKLSTVSPKRDSMKLIAFCFLVLLFFAICCCKSEISVGYRLTLAVPIELIEGFLGEAYLMETDQMPVNFRTALSVEAVDGRYTCSLGVFLGGVKVWTSGHRSKFYATETCVLELTEDGDLHLKGADERVGWRTGTSGQGVEVTLT